MKKNIKLIILFLVFSLVLVGCAPKKDSELVLQQKEIYQLAQNVGFSGTFEEWLDSIKGEQGIPGDSIELSVSDGYIKWKNKAESQWYNLVPLIDLVGTNGTDGKEVTFQVSDGYIKWQYVGETTWTNLVELSTLVGPKGDKGTDGKEVTFQVSEGFIKWQYEGDEEWSNLVELSTLVGLKGTDGKEVTFQVSEGFIKWQYEGDEEWTNLVELSTLVGPQGPKGNDGADGKSAYEVYIETHPNYTGDEQQWLDDLVNGRLATIEETKYIVTFNSDGGTMVASKEVEENKKATKPEDPTKEGYTFDGWFMGEEEWSFIGYPVTEDITLVAKWIENIDFNIEGATLENNVYHLTVDNNVTSINFKQIVQSNQTWYLSKDIDGTNINITKVGLLEIGDNTFYIIEEDGNNYNTYEINVRRLPMYTVTFITNSETTLKSIEIQEGSLIGFIPTITKEGYEFEEWDYDFTIPVTSDITLTASWTLIINYVIYHLDGGVNSINNPDKYSNISDTIMLEEATKTGFTFLGWYTEETFVNKVTKIEQGSTNDITLFARFAAETYTLHFVTNGGSEISDITEEYDKEISVSTIRDGYSFVGWHKDSSLSLKSYFELGSTMPAENLTLYAKWQPITYSITYVMNEYTTNIVSNPTTYNVTSNITLIDPTVIEGTFIGWFTDNAYTNEIENTINMTGNLTLYAKVEMNQYTITFVTNGGTEILPITQEYGTAILVSTTKEGYIFEAWCSDEGLTTSIEISKMPNANVTVYAKWVGMYEYFTIDNMTYVYYGTYPQTVVSDSGLISSLNTLTSTNANGYYEYEGSEYAKVIATPYLTEYKFMNGTTIYSGQTYYFKVEPIKWRVLEEVDGTYTLLSEYTIDIQLFYTSMSTRTIGTQTIYANNYEHSTIREWLNNDFYNQAFSTPEKGSILTTLVDNSASSTYTSTNQYTSNNTLDKVYLLSYQEAIKTTYGFSTSSTRTALTTDYARAVGAYINTATSAYGNSEWWLRSPYSHLNSYYANYVYLDGGIYVNGASVTYYGARPAIKIC